MSVSASVRLALTLVAGLLAACATLQAPLPIAADTDAGQYQRCADFFSAFDRATRMNGTRDAQAAAIEDFPYLRADRFLASFSRQEMNDMAFQTWVDQLQQFDTQARNIEMHNLSEETRLELTKHAPGGEVEQAVHHCGQLLRQSDLSTQEGRQRLLAAVHVADEYQTAKRVVGLYPLTSIIVARTIRGWHDKTRRIFDQPLMELPVHGELTLYAPPTASLLTPGQTAALIEASLDPLGVPRPNAEALEMLFASFAPVWEVDVVSDDDRIGSAVWRERENSAAPRIDTHRPMVYRHVSHTRLDGRILLQLNYIVWFPSRPKTSIFDILGGHLDGITWRVTLGPDGRPLMYDAMHNCGCYHMFFPAAALRPRRSKGWSEPPLIPQTAPEIPPATLLVIRIATGTHYIQRAYAATVSNQTRHYRFAEYDMLRSLPLPDGGHRSLFDASGIVISSHRGERWLIWPMGVPAPGSMRQWGHHANAFIGRRHFDDPDLLDSLFEPTDE
ncbi:MAG: hypothetical protein R8K46_01295 [Mariprofundaceae bacterium]